MDKKELIEKAKEALKKHKEIPPELRAKALIDRRIVDENGQVLFPMTIIGWKKDLDKVKLNHCLQNTIGYDLPQAKFCVDSVLEGKRFTIFTGDYQKAEEFIKQAMKLGVIFLPTF